MEEDGKPTSSTNQGQENVVTVFEIAKSDSMGFLNMHGMWTVAMTRCKAATVIIANHTALSKACKDNPKRARQFLFYNRLVKVFQDNNAFVNWPSDLMIPTDISSSLKPTFDKFKEIAGEAVEEVDFAEEDGSVEIRGSMIPRRRMFLWKRMEQYLLLKVLRWTRAGKEGSRVTRLAFLSRAYFHAYPQGLI